MTIAALTARFVAPFLRYDIVNADNDNAPRAYQGPYPIRAHRSLAEVWGVNDDFGPDAA